MIKIGNAYINPEDVAAIYPSAHEDGKTWIVLKGGNRVYVFADIEEAKRMLESMGVLFADSGTIQALELYSDGYRFVAQDYDGRVCAFEKRPSRSADGIWYTDSGRMREVDPEIFQSASEDIPDPLCLYDFLRGEGA